MVGSGTSRKLGLGLSRHCGQSGARVGIKLGIAGKVLGNFFALAQFIGCEIGCRALVGQKFLHCLGHCGGCCRCWRRNWGCGCRRFGGLRRSLCNFRLRLSGINRCGLWRLCGGLCWSSSTAGGLRTRFKFGACGLGLGLHLGQNFWRQGRISHRLTQRMQTRFQFFWRKFLNSTLVFENLQNGLRHGGSSGLGKTGGRKHDRRSHKQCQADEACC